MLASYQELEKRADNIMMTDPIADMLTRIRNANMVSNQTVLIPHSRIKIEILALLVKNHYIYRYEVKNRKGPNSPLLDVVVYLRYHKKQKAITNLKRVSTKNQPIYVSKDKIPYLKNGFGLVIMSTPKGILSGKEARELKIGGCVLGYVW